MGKACPRVCGEQFFPRGVKGVHPGSSPRVRGTAGDWYIVPRRPRFIPACAGNSLPYRAAAQRPPVHPRVCGEQHPAGSTSRRVDGSSPRVRGTGEGGADNVTISRFIPACAGNRDSGISRNQTTPVHPRVCGEQYPTHITHSLWVGSSPRVRGTVGLRRGRDPIQDGSSPRVRGTAGA